MSRPQCRQFFTDGPAGVDLLCRRPSGHEGPHDTMAVKPWQRYLPTPEKRAHTIELEPAEVDTLIHALGHLDRTYAQKQRYRGSRQLSDDRALLGALRVRLLRLEETGVA